MVWINSNKTPSLIGRLTQKVRFLIHTHRIHVCIFTYIYHKYQLNVDKDMVNTPYIDLVGKCIGSKCQVCPGVTFFAPLKIVSVAKTQDVSLPGRDERINSLYFHMIGDGKLNPIVGVCRAPLYVRIPY